MAGVYGIELDAVRRKGGAGKDKEKREATYNRASFHLPSYYVDR